MAGNRSHYNVHFSPGEGITDAFVMADSERVERSRRQVCRASGKPPIRVESCRIGVDVRVAVKRVWAVGDFSTRGDTPATDLGFRRRAPSEYQNRMKP